ncbi:methyltransferase type 11 [Halobacteriales archaeon QS_3_64_16]|nr:MAG: methyltransferase type 11 [Halobacteriales archaeon QS_3_64_16]
MSRFPSGFASDDRSEHGRRVYDFWSEHRGLYDAFLDLALFGREGRARRRALSVLDLDAGKRVLDLGCGPGVNFDALAERVGPAGRVVGLDSSRGMVRAARKRAARAPAPTAVLWGDATTLPTRKNSFDAAYATLSLSAMPDPESAIENLHEVLRPGGRLVVLDARPFRTGAWRALNPIVVPPATYATNWYPEADIPGAIRRTFADAACWRTNAGSLYVATGRKSE